MCLARFGYGKAGTVFVGDNNAASGQRLLEFHACARFLAREDNHAFALAEKLERIIYWPTSWTLAVKGRWLSSPQTVPAIPKRKWPNLGIAAR